MIGQREAAPASSTTAGRAGHERGSQRARAWRFWLPLAATWIIPVVALVLLIPGAQQVQQSQLSMPAPSLTEVGQVDHVYRQAVDVSVTLPAPRVVRMNISGVVTGVSVHAGDQITEGAELVAINGTPAYASRGDAPLYRDLWRGSTGPDVQAVATVLAARGLLDAGAVDSRFGPAMVTAVKALQRQMGVVPDGVFRLAYGLYVPADVTTADEVLVAVGDRINSGDELLRGLGAPSVATLTVTGGTGEAPQPPAGALALQVGDLSIALAGVPLGEADRNAVHLALTKAVASGSVSAHQVSDTTTVYSGAVLVTPQPSRVGTVPSTAIFAAGSGALCLFTVSDGDVASAKAEPVVPSGMDGVLGKVSVPASFVGKTVVTDPVTLDPAVLSRCG